MPWNFRNCTSSSENRSILGSASVRAMAPASVGIASLIISLCVTFGGASVAIISYPPKMVSLAIALDLCQLIRQEFFGKGRISILPPGCVRRTMLFSVEQPSIAEENEPQRTQSTQRKKPMKDIKELCAQVRQISYDIHVYHGHGRLEKVYV